MTRRDSLSGEVMAPIVASDSQRSAGIGDAIDPDTIEAALSRHGYAWLPGLLTDALHAGHGGHGDAAASRTAARAACAQALLAFAERCLPVVTTIGERWRGALRAAQSTAVDADTDVATALATSSITRVDSDRLIAPLGRPLGDLCRASDAGRPAASATDLWLPAAPLAVVALLSRPDEDFDGGQWIIVEQRPRMQSRPIVLPLRAGDAALVPVGVRVVQGGNGAYRHRIRHAISPVRRGERDGLLLSFGAAAALQHRR